MSAGAISGVLGKIADIEGRFTPAQTASLETAEPSLADFDPFGEVYQRAVEARPTAEPEPAAQFTAVAAASSYGLGSTAMTPTINASRGAASSAQVNAAINGVAGPPGVRPVGGYGSLSTPIELAAYGNGRVPSNALAAVHQAGSNHRLHAPAAASWNNLVAEASRAGFDLRITDSYRSYDQQVDLANRKGLYSQGGLAAVPGTSNHGWGMAVDADVTNPDLQRWLQANAPRYGWVEAVPREPWHWEFRPNQV